MACRTIIREAAHVFCIGRAAYTVASFNDQMFHVPHSTGQIFWTILSAVYSPYHDPYHDPYLTRLAGRKSNDNNVRNDIITMDHIMVYAYEYSLAMGLCTVVSVGEILHFHRNRISVVVSHVFTAVSHVAKSVPNNFFRDAVAASVCIKDSMNGMRKRIFPNSMISMARRLTRTNRTTPIQRAWRQK